MANWSQTTFLSGAAVKHCPWNSRREMSRQTTTCACRSPGARRHTESPAIRCSSIPPGGCFGCGRKVQPAAKARLNTRPTPTFGVVRVRRISLQILVRCLLFLNLRARKRGSDLKEAGLTTAMVPVGPYRIFGYCQRNNKSSEHVENIEFLRANHGLRWDHLICNLHA